MEKIEILRRSPLFDMVSAEELELAAELSRPRRYAAGEIVFAQGELGDSLFLVASGELEALHQQPGGEPKIIANYGPNEFFGEMSLVDKEHRSATVRARTDCVLLQLTADNFVLFRKHHRDGFTFVVINIARVLSARLRVTNSKLAGG